MKSFVVQEDANSSDARVVSIFRSHKDDRWVMGRIML